MTLPQRKPLRLDGYDYAQEGAYFVTACVQSHKSLFGSITENQITCNPAGEMVAHCWQKLPQKYADIELDHFIVMPNHFHGIVFIKHCQQSGVHTSLVNVMRWFKTMTTNAYIRGVNEMNWQSFERRLW